MITASLIGNGNLGNHWYQQLLKIKGIALVQWYGRSFTSQDTSKILVPTTNDLTALEKADMYILVVKDDVISDVSAQLPDGTFAVHCSGNVPLENLKNKGSKGVLYPVQTFSKERTLAFKEVPFCVEADSTENLVFLKSFCEVLGATATEMNSKQRKYLHLAAVIANNFTNFLFTQAKLVCAEHKLPFELLYPLILETAQKAKALSPQSAQTGPALRKDTQTLQQHLEFLKDSEFKNLYIALSKAIQNHYEQTELQANTP